MFVARHVVDAGGEIHRGGDPDLSGGVHLRPQEIERESRMHPPDLGRVVGEAVVALGEKRDRIDVAQAKRLLEANLVEAGTDAADVWRCVEVQMDLPKA